MVSDQDIAKGVESLLRQSDPNSITTLNGVVQQLEAQWGLDLSHKAGFIRDQINLLLRSHPQPFPPHSPPPKDHFAPNQHPQFPTTHQQQFPPHFALHPNPVPDEINFRQPQPPPTAALPLPAQLQPQPPVTKGEVFPQNAGAVASEVPKER
ncbi:hypothetical protein L6164_035992 [Bauhinia variegata]|uniref:Uncharacterized protein n=1 Tax=Bauhinia variegata TaxID=167791 RepID=A0ACB9KFW8_BAUVA|nr:hypothetical protein L6164_035992 [Bauhinia variegata]